MHSYTWLTARRQRSGLTTRTATKRRALQLSSVLTAAIITAGLVAGCGHSATADGPTTTYPGISVPEVPAGPPFHDRTVLSRNEYTQVPNAPKTNGPAKSTKQVAVHALDPTTAAELDKAFNNYYQFTGTCSRTEIVPDTVWLATIKATGVAVAVAGFQPAPGYQFASNCGADAFSDPAAVPSEAIFDKQPHRGDSWGMDSVTGKPFPCPPYPANHPGPEFGYPNVPKEVLDAWNMPYFSPHCLTIALSPYGQ